MLDFYDEFPQDFELISYIFVFNGNFPYINYDSSIILMEFILTLMNCNCRVTGQTMQSYFWGDPFLLLPKGFARHYWIMTLQHLKQSTKAAANPIIGFWFCTVYFQNCQVFFIIVHNLHFPAQLIGETQLFIWLRMILGKRWTERFILDTWQCQCLNQETILCNLMMRYYIKIYGLAHWCAIQCNFWWACTSELDINFDFHKIKIKISLNLKLASIIKPFPVPDN